MSEVIDPIFLTRMQRTLIAVLSDQWETTASVCDAAKSASHQYMTKAGVGQRLSALERYGLCEGQRTRAGLMAWRRTQAGADMLRSTT